MTLPLHDAPGSDGAYRASHADREHAARVIHDATGAGMLSLDETEERLSAVYATRFRRELPPLIEDLPVDRPAATTSRAAQVRSWAHRLWAGAVTLALTLVAWAGRHRVAAAVLGVVVIGVAASLVVAFVAFAGTEAPNGEGSEMTGH